MLEKILKTISRFRMILPGQQIAVACSGGTDSTALLLILHELSNHLGCTLSVCHMNHCLRGEDSDEDERCVRRLAEQLELRFHSQQGDARTSARSARANLEARARELRYGFLLSLVSSGQADRIAVGHTADDQAETVMHRLLRGAGSRGLAGIYPVVENQIIRPLIEIRRHVLLDWLKARQQAWREDASNLDLRYTRNRIRHQLLPLLSQFNPRIVTTLAATAEIARDEEAFWQGYLPQILSGGVRLEGGHVLIDIEWLRQNPPAAARRILRWAIGMAAELPQPWSASAEDATDGRQSQPKCFDFEQIQRLLSLAYEGQSGSTISLPAKVAARKEFGHLIIARLGESPPISQGFFHRIQVPAKVEVPEIGSSFSFELVPFAPGQTRYNSLGSTLLDCRLAEIPLTLRSWLPGDGYKPLGHRKRRKLKELFQQKKISSSERQVWPVVLAESEIVWARGLEVAEGFSPGPQSQQAVLLHEGKL